MRYDENDPESKNVEDRRKRGGFRFPTGFPGRQGGQPIRIPLGSGGMSITTLLIIGAIMLLFGINPLDLLRQASGPGGFPDIPGLPQNQGQTVGYDQTDEIPGLPGSAEKTGTSTDERRKFVGRVLADTEKVWSGIFESAGRRYDPPKLVLFTQDERTACGTGLSAMGPFYCPLDRKIYIDLSFYDELHRRFQAPGDFAQAYVIAHEVGHHVQLLLGIAQKVQEAKQRMGQAEGNELQVRMELQADCFAGIWARKLNSRPDKQRLEEGDIEEGLNAAKAIGDDTIQKRQQGYVVPDSFTHGSAEQRVRWFKRGFDTGQLSSCETFKASSL